VFCASLRHSLPQAILFRDALHGERQSRNIAGVRDDSIPTVTHQVRHAPCDVGGYCRKTAGHCFVYDESPRVGVGGKNQCVGERVKARQLVFLNEACEMNRAWTDSRGARDLNRPFVEVSPRPAVVPSDSRVAVFDKGLCRRLLRHEDTQRCHPRSG
jgi:hypothetical protein